MIKAFNLIECQIKPDEKRKAPIKKLKLFN